MWLTNKDLFIKKNHYHQATRRPLFYNFALSSCGKMLSNDRGKLNLFCFLYNLRNTVYAAWYDLGAHTKIIYTTTPVLLLPRWWWDYWFIMIITNTTISSPSSIIFIKWSLQSYFIQNCFPQCSHLTSINSLFLHPS